MGTDVKSGASRMESNSVISESQTMTSSFAGGGVSENAQSF